MSLIDCNCPTPAALATVEYNPCPTVIPKFGRFMFQRLDDANNAFVDAVNDIDLEASWSALPDAAGNTKVVITPYLEEVVINEPDILEDSENLDGAPIAVGSGPTLVTAIIRNPTPAQVVALKAIGCETNITFYPIGANEKIGCREITDTPATYAGVKISPNTFIVRDPSKGGARADQSKVMIQFYLPSGWFDSFRLITPEAGFSPLTEIAPA